ncbi:MAG TPA: hypothetical protein VKZ75_06900 [Cyclobacteriaceae bacterium]|nr:hypothetical protein [Cyclobacteriaceae bacterium]
MTICKTCLVELDDDMKRCPLCGTPVGTLPHSTPNEITSEFDEPERHLLQRILWQVTAILLLSGIVATFIIDVSINKAVTWSVYPLSICMIVLSYASFLAFWHTRIIYQILAGWALSTFLLVICSQLFPSAGWTVDLGIPILFAVNFISILLLGVFAATRRKSLNLLAFIFVAIAVLCVIIEGLLSLYFKDKIELTWSIIVAACLLPVTAALIFMYYRTRKNTNLQKIFHT